MEKTSPRHNPYIVGKPLTSDDGFYGRDDIIKQVRSILESRKNNVVLIYGQRRTGKTSILHKLERSLPMPPFVPIRFDLMDMAQKPLEEMLKELAITCLRKTNMKFPELDALSSSSDAFHEIFLPYFYAKLGKRKRPVFLFDEFDVFDQIQEKLPPNTSAITFHPYLRKLIATQHQACFVFVVGRRMEELTVDFLSTFKTAQSIPVFVLSERDAISLIQRSANQGMLYDDETVNRILFYTRGHPYFTQLLCSVIFDTYISDDEQNVRISPEMVDNIVPNALEIGATAFNWIWKGLPPAERIVFSAIAEKSISGHLLSDKDIEAVVRDAGIRMYVRELNLAPATLVEWNMLERKDGGYRFFIELMRRWVEAKQPLKKVIEEREKLSTTAEYLFGAARGFYEAQKIDLALQQVQRALEENPNHQRARSLKGIILREMGDFENAIFELNEAFKLDENEARFELIKTMLAYGKDLEEKGDLEKAEKLYDEILEKVYETEQTAIERKARIVDQKTQAILLRAKTAFEIQEFTVAETLLNEALSLQPTNNNAKNYLQNIMKIRELMMQANSAIDIGDFDRAMESLKSILDVQPDHRDAVRLRKTIDDVEPILLNVRQALQAGYIDDAVNIWRELLNMIKNDKAFNNFLRMAERLENVLSSIELAYKKQDFDKTLRALKSIIEVPLIGKEIRSFERVVIETQRLYAELENAIREGKFEYVQSSLINRLSSIQKNKNIDELRALIDQVRDTSLSVPAHLEDGNLNSALGEINQVAHNLDVAMLKELSESYRGFKVVQSFLNDATREFAQGNIERAIDKLEGLSSQLYPGDYFQKIASAAHNLAAKMKSDQLSFQMSEEAFQHRDLRSAEKNLENLLTYKPVDKKTEILSRKIETAHINESRRKTRNRQIGVTGLISIVVALVSIIGTIAALIAIPELQSLFLRATQVSEINTPTQTQSQGVEATATTPSNSLPISLESGRFVLLPLSLTHQPDGSAAPGKVAADNLQLTPGYHVLGGVPIDFSYEINTQNSSTPDYPEQISIPYSVSNPLSVYLLIQVDWGYSSFMGEQLGKLVINFENGESYEYPFIMGENIRDWKRGTASEAVTSITSSDIVFSWEGIAPDGHAGGMDLLRVSIPEGYRSQTIKTITVVDTSVEATGAITAGIRILAASVEINDDTPGPWNYQVEKIPAIDRTISWNLNAGELLILTGGSYSYSGYSCGGGASQICVLIIKSTSDATAVIDNLVPENNWLAVSELLDPRDAVSNVQDEFWLAPNCGSGCSVATVAVFSGQTFEEEYQINNPNP